MQLIMATPASVNTMPPCVLRRIPIGAPICAAGTARSGASLLWPPAHF